MDLSDSVINTRSTMTIIPPSFLAIFRALITFIDEVYYIALSIHRTTTDNS